MGEDFLKTYRDARQDEEAELVAKLSETNPDAHKEIVAFFAAVRPSDFLTTSLRREKLKLVVNESISDLSRLGIKLPDEPSVIIPAG